MTAGQAINLKVDSGATLLEFLSARLGLSRNKAKGIIDRRRVFVNGRRIWMARHNLKPGDLVTGAFETEKHAKVNRGIILYEDALYLVVNKPAGMTSNGPGSLEQELAVLCSLPALLACHRLDKDTSGCLIFAKSAMAKARIIVSFADNRVTKKYEAIVRGRISRENMTVSTPIEGQKAVTRMRLVKANPLASHVSINIETGRTHQIRKHLASIGHPVIGDQQYGGGSAVSAGERAIARQMLHAAEIEFIQPFSGITVRAMAPLPADMKDCLRQYRLN
jgi:RluA family pseudouridine synthase